MYEKIVIYNAQTQHTIQLISHQEPPSVFFTSSESEVFKKSSPDNLLPQTG